MAFCQSASTAAVGNRAPSRGSLGCCMRSTFWRHPRTAHCHSSREAGIRAVDEKRHRRTCVSTRTDHPMDPSLARFLRHRVLRSSREGRDSRHAVSCAGESVAVCDWDADGVSDERVYLKCLLDSAACKSRSLDRSEKVRNAHKLVVYLSPTLPFAKKRGEIELKISNSVSIFRTHTHTYTSPQ
jgi:hypothetical protein